MYVYYKIVQCKTNASRSQFARTVASFLGQFWPVFRIHLILTFSGSWDPDPTKCSGLGSGSLILTYKLKSSWSKTGLISTEGLSGGVGFSILQIDFFYSILSLNQSKDLHNLWSKTTKTKGNPWSTPYISYYGTNRVSQRCSRLLQFYLADLEVLCWADAGKVCLCSQCDSYYPIGQYRENCQDMCK